ncbi:MAG: lipopolysaccharide transport periplasmic protein LptA [Gammaproteobacteria bacterium]|nr:lipopolysaccharide transport periplasmic protein LptA [Gammaproteobacteria bacterium]
MTLFAPVLTPVLLRRNLTLAITVFAVLVFLASTSSASDDDRSQPIQIGSSSAFVDYKKGITTYEGSVELSQGSLRITADKINIYRDKTGFKKLVATGSPASFQQTPIQNKPPVVAEAKQINYNVRTEVLTLKENVFIQLEDSAHRGAFYEYNLATQVLKASGDMDNRIITIFSPPNAPLKQED